ncbi:hypothetical protein AYI69_g5698 [Smittium culicis]|uniref:Uncharacterized protein n=1 Tax=Smittium culicis TaxID=133412 RepID=A0A1R1Y4Q0_9FUNG|nr:hypothetical protein AYI69_g5698 [Smittium culicis]
MMDSISVNLPSKKKIYVYGKKKGSFFDSKKFSSRKSDFSEKIFNSNRLSKSQNPVQFKVAPFNNQSKPHNLSSDNIHLYSEAQFPLKFISKNSPNKPNPNSNHNPTNNNVSSFVSDSDKSLNKNTESTNKNTTKYSKSCSTPLKRSVYKKLPTVYIQKYFNICKQIEHSSSSFNNYNSNNLISKQISSILKTPKPKNKIKTECYIQIPTADLNKKRSYNDSFPDKLIDVFPDKSPTQFKSPISQKGLISKPSSPNSQIIFRDVDLDPVKKNPKQQKIESSLLKLETLNLQLSPASTISNINSCPSISEHKSIKKKLTNTNDKHREEVIPNIKSKFSIDTIKSPCNLTPTSNNPIITKHYLPVSPVNFIKIKSKNSPKVYISPRKFTRIQSLNSNNPNDILNTQQLIEVNSNIKNTPLLKFKPNIHKPKSSYSSPLIYSRKPFKASQNINSYRYTPVILIKNSLKEKNLNLKNAKPIKYLIKKNDTVKIPVLSKKCIKKSKSKSFKKKYPTKSKINESKLDKLDSFKLNLEIVKPAKKERRDCTTGLNSKNFEDISFSLSSRLNYKNSLHSFNIDSSFENSSFTQPVLSANIQIDDNDNFDSWSIESSSISSEDSLLNNTPFNSKAHLLLNDLPSTGPLIRSRASKNITYTYGKSCMKSKNISSSQASSTHLRFSTSNSSVNELMCDSDYEDIVWNASNSQNHTLLHQKFTSNDFLTPHNIDYDCNSEKILKLSKNLNSFIDRLSLAKNAESSIRIYFKFLSKMLDSSFLKVICTNPATFDLFNILSKPFHNSLTPENSDLLTKVQSFTFLLFMIAVLDINPKVGYELILEHRALERVKKSTCQKVIHLQNLVQVKPT